MRNPQQGPSPNNYRQTTCLPTIWTLLSEIVADKLEQHISHYLINAQRGNEHSIQWAKQQLLVDQTICQHSGRRHTNLAMAWVNFKKAIDSIHHSWMLECLRLYIVHPAFATLIKMSRTKWKTELKVNYKNLASVKVYPNIYQGEFLSSLLSCICLNSVSIMLGKTKYGYHFSSGSKINHLLSWVTSNCLLRSKATLIC